MAAGNESPTTPADAEPVNGSEKPSGSVQLKEETEAASTGETPHVFVSCAKKSESGIILIPQPSNSPRDPLVSPYDFYNLVQSRSGVTEADQYRQNWTSRRKAKVVAVLFLAMFTGFSAPFVGQLNIQEQAALYGKTPVQITYFVRHTPNPLTSFTLTDTLSLELRRLRRPRHRRLPLVAALQQVRPLVRHPLDAGRAARGTNLGAVDDPTGSVRAISGIPVLFCLFRRHRRLARPPVSRRPLFPTPAREGVYRPSPGSQLWRLGRSDFWWLCCCQWPVLASGVLVVYCSDWVQHHHGCAVPRGNIFRPRCSRRRQTRELGQEPHQHLFARNKSRRAHHVEAHRMHP